MVTDKPQPRPSAKPWQRSVTHPDEAVFIHYEIDPDEHGGCKQCFFVNKDDCNNNNCDNGYYITLERAVAIKMEAT
jgi:hypothetical protein